MGLRVDKVILEVTRFGCFFMYNKSLRLHAVGKRIGLVC